MNVCVEGQAITKMSWVQNDHKPANTFTDGLQSERQWDENVFNHPHPDESSYGSKKKELCSKQWSGKTSVKTLPHQPNEAQITRQEKGLPALRSV